MFDGCVRSVLWCLGESHEFDFTFASTLSGDMFTQTYNPDASEGTCSLGLTERFFTPDIAFDVFRMCGYDITYIDPEEIGRNPDNAMEAIIASIDKGVPVMTLGLGYISVADRILDSVSDFSLIGGYDGDGVMYVNVYREDAVTDGFGYVTVKHGLNKSKGLFIVCEKINTPHIAEISKEVILSLPKWLIRKPIDGYHFGIDAFSEWEKALLNDDLYIGMTSENYDDFIWKRHCGALLIVCSYGANALGFVARAVELNPGFETGNKLIPIFKTIMELGRDLHFQIQGDFVPPYEKFIKPEFRRLIAEQIYKIRECYEEILRLV